MKKYLFFILLLTLSVNSFSQQNDPVPPLSKQDYLKKSKQQKTEALIFLSGGIIIVSTVLFIVVDDIIGIVEPGDKEKSGLASILALTGTAAVAISIPLFISSAKNKKKAMSLSFKNEPFPQLQKTSLAYRAIPSLGLKISL